MDLESQPWWESHPTFALTQRLQTVSQQPERVPPARRPNDPSERAMCRSMLAAGMPRRVIEIGVGPAYIGPESACVVDIPSHPHPLGHDQIFAFRRSDLLVAGAPRSSTWSNWHRRLCVCRLTTPWLIRRFKNLQSESPSFPHHRPRWLQ